MAEKNRAAQALGALGGKARARALSKERQSEIGRKAGLASAAKRKAEQQAETYLTCLVCGGPTGQPTRICSSKCEALKQQKEQTTNEHDTENQTTKTD